MIILVTIDFHSNIKLILSEPIYESKGWIVSSGDCLFYEVDNNISSSNVLKKIFDEYQLGDLEQYGVVKAKRITIYDVPNEVDIPQIARSIVNLSGPIKPKVDSKIPEIVIPLQY